MNPRLLKTLLTWVAPLLIGFIVKKFEEKQKKKQEKQITGQP